MLSTDDTIAAVASPPGRGARAVLRVSGPRALDAVAGILRSPVRLESDTPGFAGWAVTLGLGSASVRAWALRFRAPRSYTGEDLVELWLPSAPPILAATLRGLLARENVRRAGPGEFTLRAFLAGRMDLSRSEAVEQLIAAGDEREARAARRGLDGELGVRARGVADRVLDALSLIEAGLDFADEDIPELAPEPVLARLREAEEEVRALRASTRLRLSPPGVFRAVIAGHPNAGKSTLLNALLGREAALVSGHAGTTRDPVRGTTREDGVEIEWVDVAGAAGVSGDVEPEEGSGACGRRGPRPDDGSGDEDAPAGLEASLEPEARALLRRMTRVELDHADRVLWVVDGASDGAERSLREYRMLDRRALLVVSQIDRLEPEELAAWRRRAPGASWVSAWRGDGIEALRRRVASDAGAVHGVARRDHPPSGGDAAFLTSAHQEAALLRAVEGTARARAALEHGPGPECAAADLREALGALEEITGRVTGEEVLDRIFSRFCIGK